MNLLKRTRLYVSFVFVLMLVITGCGSSTKSGIVEGKVNVVTTFYPIYEFASAIGGENVNVINLIPAGVEPHDWTPLSQDMVNVSKAQLFLYNGAGLEGWVPSFLKGLNKESQVQAVEVSKGIELIDSEGDDGHNHGAAGHNHDEDAHTEDEHAHEHGEEGHSHEDEAAHDHGEEAAHDEDAANDNLHQKDPHTWVSPKSAIIMAENIKNSLVEADPANQSGYEERYEELLTRLQELDQKFETELANVSSRTIVVSHQAFGYLCRDYNLEQHAIMGLSADAEPRAQDIVNLSKLVKEEGIKYIFFEELVSDRLAKTLADETGVETLVLNPVEGLTPKQVKNGDNYFSLMEKNLQNLILALQ